jgi:hypothetical protein
MASGDVFAHVVPPEVAKRYLTGKLLRLFPLAWRKPNVNRVLSAKLTG